MRDPFIRALGLCVSLLYAAFVVWLYATQPRTLAEVTGGMSSSVGLYRVDPHHFQEGLRFFRNDQFPEARGALQRADPAGRDPTTQFYVAYSLYRQGWGRVYNDDALFRQGLAALERAVAAAPDGRIVVEDQSLGLRTGDELRAELERGLSREASDFNPLRVFDKRK
jgi:hypothetical protein